MAVPEMMLGSFQMETSEGFDEFMYEMGVNMFTRLIIIIIMISIFIGPGSNWGPIYRSRPI